MFVFLESLTSDFNKGMETVYTFYTIAKNQYNLEKSNAETLVMSESVDEAQFEYLYEEAEKTLNEKSKKAVETIKAMLEKFCAGIKNKINNSKSDLSDCETKAKTNPFMKKGEVKINDTREEIKVCEEFLNKAKNLAIKKKSGVATSKDIANLKKEYNISKKKAAAGAAVVVSVPVAIGLWKKYADSKQEPEVAVAVSDDVELVKLCAEMTKDQYEAICKLTESARTSVTNFSSSISNKQKKETVAKESGETEMDNTIIESVDTEINNILTDLLESVMNTPEEVVNDLAECSVTESVVDESPEDHDDVFTESAKFTVLPKFKSMTKVYPELGKHTELIKEAELLASSEGVKSSNRETLIKVGKVLCRVLGFIEGLESAVMLPVCILIFPIISLLIARFCKFVFDLGEFALAEQQSLEMIAKLSKIKKETDDKDLKRKCEKLIEKIKDNMDELKTESVTDTIDFSHVMEMTDEEKLNFVDLYIKESSDLYMMEACKHIDEFIHERKIEVVSDIMEDVLDDHLTDTCDTFEIY